MINNFHVPNTSRYSYQNLDITVFIASDNILCNVEMRNYLHFRFTTQKRYNKESSVAIVHQTNAGFKMVKNDEQSQIFGIPSLRLHKRRYAELNLLRGMKVAFRLDDRRYQELAIRAATIY